MPLRTLAVVGLLAVSNFFMTLAWYGHLQFKRLGWFTKAGLATIVLISWGLALFEYVFQVPANRLGFKGDGGPFSLFELKVLQEVVSLVVFTLVTTYVFKTERLAWNHAVGFGLLVAAVFFVFRKW